MDPLLEQSNNSSMYMIQLHGKSLTHLWCVEFGPRPSVSLHASIQAEEPVERAIATIPRTSLTVPSHKSTPKQNSPDLVQLPRCYLTNTIIQKEQLITLEMAGYNKLNLLCQAEAMTVPSNQDLHPRTN